MVRVGGGMLVYWVLFEIICIYTCIPVPVYIVGFRVIRESPRVTFQREASRYMPAAKALRKTHLQGVFFFSSLYFCCSFVCVCVCVFFFFFFCLVQLQGLTVQAVRGPNASHVLIWVEK